MEDRLIVNLYLMRQEEAISRSQSKYGALLRSIAYAVLSDREDAAECENDTYYTAWNKFPPDRPTLLGAYLSKITRFLALNRFTKKSAAKRVGETAPLEELYECIPSPDTVESHLEEGALKEVINGFLRSLDREKRCIFIKRYFYMASIADIAKELELSESGVKVQLFRMRASLKEILLKEGLL